MTTKWTSKKFAVAPLQIIDGDRGKNYPKHADFHDAGYCLFLNTGNVTQHGFNFGKCQFITEEKDDALRKGKLLRGDVVMTTRGTVGNVAHYNDAIPFEHVRINSGMVIFRTHGRELLPGFLYHFLRSNIFKRQVSSLRTGAAQPQLPIRDIRTISVPVPTIAIQHRIADILSAYDDLIENNRRRITFLERAARELYREWLVRLRFPGHEHTKIVDGVPEGWERKTLGGVLAELESGGRPKGGATEDGIPSIGAENVTGIGQYDFSKEKYVPEDYFNSMRKGVIRSRDVVVYKDGANIGRSSYFGDGFPHDECAVNEHVFILRVLPQLGQSFLYFWVAQDETRQRIANLNANTAQPGVSQGKLKTLSFVQPARVVTSVFNENVEPIVRQIFLLARENQRLTKARDLLLPRLMSGEVAV